METKPTPEHEWLMRLVGEWTYQSSCVMGPDQEPMTGIMTLGYDPIRERFIGNWIGSPMAHMFVYDGTRDASGNVLTLDTVGPSFADPSKMAKYQDIVEVRGPDERVLRSQALGDDGSWTEFMSAVYTRVK